MFFQVFLKKKCDASFDTCHYIFVNMIAFFLCLVWGTTAPSTTRNSSTQRSACVSLLDLRCSYHQAAVVLATMHYAVSFHAKANTETEKALSKFYIRKHRKQNSEKIKKISPRVFIRQTDRFKHERATYSGQGENDRRSSRHRKVRSTNLHHESVRVLTRCCELFVVCCGTLFIICWVSIISSGLARIVRWTRYLVPPVVCGRSTLLV